MMMEHLFSLDLLNPGLPHRIQVKQGDTMTHSLRINLLSGGEPWLIPAEVIPAVRWSACDPDTGRSARGIYDTLPDGGQAWNYSDNQLNLITIPQMFALPGLVQADVLFRLGSKLLATCNFEFYVNRAPADGTEPEAQSYYKVATLEQINAALADLQAAQANADQRIAQLEHEVYALKEIVSNT